MGMDIFQQHMFGHKKNLSQDTRENLKILTKTGIVVFTGDIFTGYFSSVSLAVKPNYSKK